MLVGVPDKIKEPGQVIFVDGGMSVGI